MAKTAAAPVEKTLKERQAMPVLDKGMVGTYGDITLHGSKLTSAVGDAKPSENNELEQPLHWTFNAYTPADIAELIKLCNAKPDMMLELVTEKLVSKARAQSWATVRGTPSNKLDIILTVNGVETSSRVDAEVVDAMRKAGMTITVVHVDRTRKAKKSKSK